MKRAFVVRLGIGVKVDSDQRVDCYVADMQTGRELTFHSLDELLAFFDQSARSDNYNQDSAVTSWATQFPSAIANSHRSLADDKGDSRRIRVLFVEDQPSIIDIFVEKLSQAGLAVQAQIVNAPRDFENKLREGVHDLILCDYQMAGWTGREALQIRNAVDPPIPFILVTGEIGDDEAITLLQAGATDYVLKSRLNRLSFAVRRALIERETREQIQLFIEALEQSEQRYRLLFDSSPQPLWVYNLEDLGFLAVNQAAIEHYGYSRQEFLSMTVQQLLTPEPESRSADRIHGMGQIDTRTQVAQHRTKEGKTIQVEITESQLEFEGKKARLALITDITERLHALRSLRRSEAEYRSIIEGAPYGICRVDQDGGMHMANPALVGILGYGSEAEVLGLNLMRDIYHKNEDGVRAMQHLRGQKQMRTCEAEWRSKHGLTIPVRLSGRELPNGKGAHQYEIFVEDITERRSLEQQFRQSQKIEAIGRLAGGVAHDFNNLLTVIKGYGALASDALHDADRVREALEEIRFAADRGASLTQQLLAFSRKQILEPAILDLNLLIPRLIAILPRLIGENISVVFRPGERLGNVKADRGQIEQAIMNLAVNARDAMPNGGTLTIETANVELDEKYSSGHGVAVTPGSYIMLSVSDTGTGMSPETQLHIFEPFFTTKEFGKGTGLGLASVYGFVKQSGGSIWVYSEIGKGSTFKIYLPRVGEADRTGSSKTPKSSAPGGSETILLVEDEVKLRTVIAAYLRSKGYRVLEATGGADGIRISRDHPESIEVLITDMVMPEISGVDIVKAARSVREKLKVIYMSGYSDRGFDEAVAGPNSSFLKKPFTFESLAEEIRRLLEGRPTNN